MLIQILLSEYLTVLIPVICCVKIAVANKPSELNCNMAMKILDMRSAHCILVLNMWCLRVLLERTEQNTKPEDRKR